MSNAETRIEVSHAEMNHEALRGAGILPAAMKPMAPRQVLVVDDDAGMRTALEISFLRHGWRVETATGANDAMSKFRRGQHPLMVTDIRMPDGDGFGVMREARALAPRTAVILLTAFGSVPDAVTAMRNGACDYLVKPVSFEQLEHAAQRILARTQEADSGPGTQVGHSPALLRRPRPRPASRGHRRRHSDSGRKRYGQGIAGAHDSSPQPAPRSSICRRELCCLSRDLAGE